MPHNNISIFIPHLGCPHMCSFCKQRSISETQRPTSIEEIAKICTEAFEEIEYKKDTEVAFFGGSFTAVDRNYMIKMLEIVQPFLGKDGFYGIRLSTRPDYIDDEVLSILKEYGVTAIELGAQSMSDEVLTANERGHTAEDVRKASALIKKYGFELGLQMMTGLYKSTVKTDSFTADEIIKLKPKTVRIYPVVVMDGTRLGYLYKNGEYKLYSFDEAVELCADLLLRFENSGISVIKLGLHASEMVEEERIAGYYHPAFRELCEGIIYRKEIEKEIIQKGNFNLYVNPKDISKVTGHKKTNLKYFSEKGINIKICPDKELEGRKVVAEEV